jgi:hypothetical protein
MTIDYNLTTDQMTQLKNTINDYLKTRDSPCIILKKYSIDCYKAETNDPAECIENMETLKSMLDYMYINKYELCARMLFFEIYMMMMRNFDKSIELVEELKDIDPEFNYKKMVSHINRVYDTFDVYDKVLTPIFKKYEKDFEYDPMIKTPKINAFY